MPQITPNKTKIQALLADRVEAPDQLNILLNTIPKENLGLEATMDLPIHLVIDKDPANMENFKTVFRLSEEIDKDTKEWPVWKTALNRINTKTPEGVKKFEFLWNEIKDALDVKDCRALIFKIVNDGGSEKILDQVLENKKTNLNESFADCCPVNSIGKYQTNWLNLEKEEVYLLAISKTKEVAEVLVKHGANLEKKMKDGQKIHQFIKERHDRSFEDMACRTRMVTWLSKNVVTEWNQESAWDGVLNSRQTNDINRIVVESKKGWVNWRGKNGESFLHVLAITNTTALKNTIKRSECQKNWPEIEDDNGFNVLDYAFGLSVSSYDFNRSAMPFLKENHLIQPLSYTDAARQDVRTIICATLLYEDLEKPLTFSNFRYPSLWRETPNTVSDYTQNYTQKMDKIKAAFTDEWSGLLRGEWGVWFRDSAIKTMEVMLYKECVLDDGRVATTSENQTQILARDMLKICSINEQTRARVFCLMEMKKSIVEQKPELIDYKFFSAMKASGLDTQKFLSEVSSKTFDRNKFRSFEEKYCLTQGVSTQPQKRKAL